MPMIRRENILRQRFPWELKFWIFRSCAVPLSGRICIQYPDDHETGTGICGDDPKARSGVPGSDKIYAGFEAEYVPEFYEEQMRMFRNLGCDYMIMGQHFLGSEENGPYTGTETEDESRIRRYVDLVIEGMQTGSYAYLAHPDLMNYQGMDSVYDWEMTRLCKEMKELDIPLEINMLGMGEGARHYPAERFWKIAGEVGNKAILGLDAHCVRHIQDMDSYRKCMELVEKYNLNLINKLEL